MVRFTMVAALALAPALAAADGVDGVWKTGANSKGGYLEITMAPCSADASLTCGTITRAFNSAGEDPGYANLGKIIVKDMKADGDSAFLDGTIWDPEDGETYDSKMTLKGDELDVEGCVAIFCSGQDWTRVK